MKVTIVSAWQDRYDGDRRSRAVPSLSAIHLAALCPPHVEVSVIHEHVRTADPEAIDADLVGITATTGSAERMYALADRLRERGIAVVLGGPHATLMPEEAMTHADAVALGDAEESFPRMLADFEQGHLARIYRQPEGRSLAGLPVPRYDLLEDEFDFRCYVQATRGCPYRCSFCTLKVLDRHFRVRPVAEVLRDIRAGDGRNWLQRKFVWFWDDNLTGDHRYAADLFRGLIPLRRWWWSQCSIDLAQDRQLLRLAAESGCLGVFVGVETFSEENLRHVGKRHNRVSFYRDAVRAFHDFGIAVQAGIIVGMDQDSEESIRLIPELVADLGLDLAFVNVLTPFPRTPLQQELERDDRLYGAGWHLHDAAHVTFAPRNIAAADLESAYWRVHHELYSVRRTIPRVMRTLRDLRPGAVVLNGYVNALLMVQNLIHPDRPWAEDRLAELPRHPVAPPGAVRAS